MPLKAVDVRRGETLLSIDPDVDWTDLKLQVRAGRHLAMLCCGATARLKRSKLGLQFFAHAGDSECATGPEAIHHLRLKEIVVRRMRHAGWNVDVEVAGSTSRGREWRADVLGWKGEVRVAVEIQWSHQTDELLTERQSRYRESGTRALWVIRHAGFEVSEDIPAVVVMPDGDGYSICVPKWSFLEPNQRRNRRHPEWHQTMPFDGFIDAVFERRLAWGPTRDGRAKVELWGRDADCWYCQCRIRKVVSIVVRVDGLVFWGDLGTFDDDENLLHETFPKSGLLSLEVGEIRRRFSKSTQSEYLSNGCKHCGSIQGRYAERFGLDGSLESNRPITSTSVVFDYRWRRAFEPQFRQWNVSPQSPADLSKCKNRRESSLTS